MAIMLAETEDDLEAVFWSDTYNGIGTPGPFPADAFIDVSDVWNAKLAAIKEHQSQQPTSYCEMIGRQCAAHGAVCGVSFAEGFRRVPFLGTGRRAAATLWEFC
jgi:LmbE family N-acetylglucosaminyl deacetylase